MLLSGHTRARRFYEARGFRAIRFTDGANNEERTPEGALPLGADRRLGDYPAVCGGCVRPFDRQFRVNVSPQTDPPPRTGPRYTKMLDFVIIVVLSGAPAPR